MNLNMDDPVAQYVFINAGLCVTILEKRARLVEAYAATEDELVREVLNEVYKTLHVIANHLNLKARWEQVGSTPASDSTPEAPEVQNENVPGIGE